MKNVYSFISIVLFMSTAFCTAGKQPEKNQPTKLSQKNIAAFTQLARKLAENKACKEDCETLDEILTDCEQKHNLQKKTTENSQLSAMLGLPQQSKMSNL